MVCHSNFKYFRQRLLLTIISFLIMGDRELVIVSAVILFHISGKQGEMKAVLLYLLAHLVLDAA